MNRILKNKISKYISKKRDSGTFNFHEFISIFSLSIIDVVTHWYGVISDMLPNNGIFLNGVFFNILDYSITNEVNRYNMGNYIMSPQLTQNWS